MNGLELQQELNRRGWSIPVIFATGHGTIRLAIEAIRAGAFEFLEKPLDEDVLLDSVRRALLSPEIGGQDLKGRLRVRALTLTSREREILESVATGDTSKAIAQKLGISFRTVDVHRANIIQKLGARGPADLVRFATIIGAAEFK
jgi:FixJ family two-component response regulator